MLDYKVTYSQMKEWLAECAQKADPRASAPFYTLPVKLSRFLRKLVRRPPPPPWGGAPKGVELISMMYYYVYKKSY